MVPFYTPEWNPDIENEQGQALIKIYLHMLEQVISRLNQVPDKNFVAFLNMMGIKLRPAQSAKAVVTFNLAEGTQEHVTVPNGTLLAGEGTDGEEVTFETQSDLRLTPSLLKEIVSINAAKDQIFVHTDQYTNSEDFHILSGENKQERSLYIGHTDLFSLTNPTDISIGFTLKNGATGGVLKIVWDYWNGERWIEMVKFDASETTINPNDTTALFNKSGTMLVNKVNAGEISIYELYKMKSRWLRCRLRNSLSSTNTVLLPEMETIQLSVKSTDFFSAELAFNNDIPVNLEEKNVQLTTFVDDVDLGFVSLSTDKLVLTLQDAGFLVSELEVGDFLYLSNQKDAPEHRHIKGFDSINPSMITLDRALEFDYSENVNVELNTAVRERDKVILAFSSDVVARALEVGLNDTGGIEIGDVVELSNANDAPELRKIVSFTDTTITLDKPLNFGYLTSDATHSVKVVLYISEVKTKSTKAFDVANKNIVFKHDDDKEYVLIDSLAVVEKDNEQIVEEICILRSEDQVGQFYSAGNKPIISRIKPFGELPGLFDTFYIASDEAFSKKSSDVILMIDAELKNNSSLSNPENAVLSWEYWNGTSWRVLLVNDATDRFSKPEEDITFICPEDIAQTEVNGEEKYWIRVRIIDGNYGKEIIIVPTNNGTDVDIKKGIIHYPIINELKISYKGKQVKPQHCFSLNNLDFEDHITELVDPRQSFTPFNKLPEQFQGLFLGFDKQIVGGPVRILFNLTEQIVTEADTLKIQWFFWQGDHWSKINSQDGTGNLTRKDLLEFSLPVVFESRKLFDKEQYWIKGNVIEGAFKELDSNEEGLKVPELIGIFPNSTYAIQASIINDEVIGTSDLTANQAFQLFNPLIISQTLFINEPTKPSDDEEKLIIQEEGEEAIEPITDQNGEILNYRVRWHEVDDFYQSEAKSRHYIVDKRQGIIQFGDGINGLVPPLGQDNIKINYRYGGGANGNVDVGKIAALKNAIPFVNEVNNQLPADGGADTETLEEVLERGPKRLKNRDRAVTSDDYAALARDASRKIKRAKCLPNTNAEGEFALGHVSVIIVPDTQKGNETVSRLLVKTVQEFLEKYSVNLVSVPRDIDVRGAEYVEITIEPSVVPVSLEASARVDTGIIDVLSRYIHPITGGEQGNGWEFGKNICHSEIIALLEGVTDVEYVQELVILVNGKKQAGDITFDDDMLPYSGEHRVNLVFGSNGDNGRNKKPDSTCQDQINEFCAEESL